MKNDVKMTNKLKFEKPQVFGAEFLTCLVPTVATTYPWLATVAASCSVPALLGTAALAVPC